MFCPNCGAQAADDARFCANCGQALTPLVQGTQTTGEKSLGCILFGGYYKDICFTDRRVIQFEPIKDRWKFVMQALGPERLMVDTQSTLEDVLLFIKSEIPRTDIASIEIGAHGIARRGHIRLVKKNREVVELARIDVDVKRESYDSLVTFIKSIYPEVQKSIE